MHESGNHGGVGGWEVGDAGRQVAAEAGGMCKSGHWEVARKCGHVQVGTCIHCSRKCIGFSILTVMVSWSGLVCAYVYDYL
jgi:hypothetical protein